jgi:hypothetical protein
MAGQQTMDEDASRFEWDDHKNFVNTNKHGVSFEDAAEAFSDPRSFEYRSPAQHSEQRCVLVGMMQTRLISVVYTLTGSRIRIISARAARREERKLWNANIS